MDDETLAAQMTYSVAFHRGLLRRLDGVEVAFMPFGRYALSLWSLRELVTLLGGASTTTTERDAEVVALVVPDYYITSPETMLPRYEVVGLLVSESAWLAALVLTPEELLGGEHAGVAERLSIFHGPASAS